MLATISLGTVSISTYNLMIGMGAIGMLICILYRRMKFDFSVLQSVMFTLLLTVCGIAGALLLYWLENGFQFGGTSFFGSVFLIVLVMPLIGKMFGLKITQTLDLCAPCIAVMVGFIRVGCLLSGCCGGWVVYVGNVYFAWPTQIMESIGDFIIAIWLLRIEAYKKWQGALCPLFMLLYSIMRFFIEFLRYKSSLWFGLGHGQWYAIISIIIATVWLLKYKKMDSIK